MLIDQQGRRPFLSHNHAFPLIFPVMMPDVSRMRSSGIRSLEMARISQNAEAVPEKGSSPASEQQNHKKTARMLKQCRRRGHLRHQNSRKSTNQSERKAYNVLKGQVSRSQVFHKNLLFGATAPLVMFCMRLLRRLPPEFDH